MFQIWNFPEDSFDSMTLQILPLKVAKDLAP